MKKGFKKLALLGCMAGASALTLFSTTYAFVTLNTTTNVSEFGFDIENQEGLLISLDGVNYFQDLNYTQISKQIVKNAGLDPKVNTLDDIKYTPVTLVGKEDQSVLFEEYTYEFGHDKVEHTGNKPAFVKDSLVLEEREDGSNEALPSDPEGNNDIYYRHEMIAAEVSNYVYVDFWFKIATNGEETSEYNLKFTDRTAITGTDNKVMLKNKMTTTGTAEPDKLVELGDYTGTRGTGEYFAEDIITINPADAMRIGVVAHNVESTSEDHTLYVYEPNMGFGSAAVEDEPNADPLKDPSTNAMYTYYNETHPLSIYHEGATYHKGFDTYADVEENVFGTFKYNETTGYDTIHITLMIWLEGWDADYIMGVTANEVLVKLGFEAVEVE